MEPVILEDHVKVGVDVGWIVRRIISHLPLSSLEGLKEVRLLGHNEKGFARYISREGVIEIYVEELLKDFRPIFLKVFYPLTYTIVGMAFCHELDHHVHRSDGGMDKEASAEANVMKYMYPSLGVFKPAAKLISVCVGRIKSGKNIQKPG